MVICGVRTHRQRQAVAIHYRHDFHALSTLGRTDLRAPALGHRKGRVDEALFFVQYPSVAKFVGDIRQNLTQNFAVRDPGNFAGYISEEPKQPSVVNLCSLNTDREKANGSRRAQ